MNKTSFSIEERRNTWDRGRGGLFESLAILSPGKNWRDNRTMKRDCMGIRC
jgi:hypothetical protein